MPFSFLEMWAIKINPVPLKPCGNGVALPGFRDSRASAAWGFLCLHALQGVKHLNRVIPPFQSHGQEWETFPDIQLWQTDLC